MTTTMVNSMLVIMSAIIFAASAAQDKPFQGHQVLRIRPSTSEDLKLLTDLEEPLKLDFWHLPHTLGDHVDVRVAPEFLQRLKDRLREVKLDYEELVKDVQNLVNRESGSIRRRRAMWSLEEYTKKYLSYNEINYFLNGIKQTVPGTSLINIGSSFEGRPTYAIKIGTETGNIKPAILIDAGIHAREWIAPATAINFIYKLAVNPEGDGEVRDLLSKFDFYIAPLINPDGYEYSRSNLRNRLWRKNRRSFNGSYCMGVDVNRNFGYEWNPAAGGSDRPCSDLYSGSTGFSEKESQNLRDFMLSLKPRVKGYLTLHSYGQYWLYPWGFSRQATAEDENILQKIAEDSVNAMNRPYTIGSSAKVLYVAAGGSDDFAKGVAGIPYSYTVELPPTSANYNGFLLPESQISAVASDTFRGLKSFAYGVYERISPTQRPPTTSTATTTTSRIPYYYYQWMKYYFGK